MIIQRPDVINDKTKVIQLGNLEARLVDIKDNLIDNNKKSNKSLRSGYWINLDNEIYYFKIPHFTQGYINELLGEKISLEFGLDTIHNQLAEGIVKVNGKEVKIYGLLSKWARKPDYNYQSLKDIIYGTNPQIKPNTFDSSNLSILKSIDQVYKDQPICKQFRGFITRDFFTQETDRVENEILIAKKDNKIELGFLSDYEYEWQNLSSKYQFFKYLKLDLSDQQTISEIKQDPFFQEAFTKALEINVIYLLEQIKEEHKIKLIDYDKNYYKEKEEQIKQLIRSKKLG